MAITVEEIRLRIVEVVVPTCSKHQLTHPDDIAKIASSLEQYVLRPAQEVTPSPRNGKRGSRPKGAQPVDPLS